MKENTLFKLDLLQAYYLQKQPRFGITKQMMRSEKYQSKKKAASQGPGSNRSEKQKHKLLQLSRSEAFELITRLQHDAFEKKIHFFESNIHRIALRVLKKEKQKLTSLQKDQNKDSDKISKQVEAIESLLSKNSPLLQSNIKHKIFKCLIREFPDKLDIKNNSFDKSIPGSAVDCIRSMKDSNPYKTNGEVLNNLFSKVYADKSVKEAFENIQSLEILWGPKKYSKENDAELEKFDADNRSDVENDSLEESNADANEDLPALGENIDVEKLYDGYKAYLAASSDEEEEDANDGPGFSLDPSINYNEITDDEASQDSSDESEEEDQQDSNKRSIEDDDFFASESKKPKPGKPSSLRDIQLPALATGYYSGGESDEEVKDDALVDELTKPRKNRRGQRARQKIWEKKYGSGAKHVIKEHERSKSERERLREEYEARKLKREAKQKQFEERKREREDKNKVQVEKSLHPSWEAKLKAQESLKKATFSGKKITFD